MSKKLREPLWGGDSKTRQDKNIERNLDSGGPAHEVSEGNKYAIRTSGVLFGMHSVCSLRN